MINLGGENLHNLNFFTEIAVKKQENMIFENKINFVKKWTSIIKNMVLVLLLFYMIDNIFNLKMSWDKKVIFACELSCSFSTLFLNILENVVICFFLLACDILIYFLLSE